MSELHRSLGISQARAREAKHKAKMISEILKLSPDHAAISNACGLPLSVVTAILDGSSQKVLLGDVIKIAKSLGLDTTEREQ